MVDVDPSAVDDADPSAVVDVDPSAGKVNTHHFCQDGPAAHVPSGPSGVIFSFFDCCVGFWTACSPECSDEDVWITGDECN